MRILSYSRGKRATCEDESLLLSLQTEQANREVKETSAATQSCHFQTSRAVGYNRVFVTDTLLSDRDPVSAMYLLLL